MKNLKNYITKMECDPVIDAANSYPLGGGGDYRALYQAPGKVLLTNHLAQNDEKGMVKRNERRRML